MPRPKPQFHLPHKSHRHIRSGRSRWTAMHVAIAGVAVLCFAVVGAAGVLGYRYANLPEATEQAPAVASPARDAYPAVPPAQSVAELIEQATSVDAPDGLITLTP